MQGIYLCIQNLNVSIVNFQDSISVIELSWENIGGIFVFLYIGLFIGVVVFICEVVIDCFADPSKKEKKRRKKRSSSDGPKKMAFSD